MSAWKKFCATLGAFAMTAMASIALSEPANAAYTDCASGYTCAWQPTSYAGQPDAKATKRVVLTTSSNRINSIVNNGVSQIALYFDRNDYTGVYITLNNPARGGQWRDPALVNGTDKTPVNWANRISSMGFANYV